MKSIEQFKKEIQEIKSIQDLNLYKNIVLGRKGLITLELSKIKDLSAEEKKKFGKEINQIKSLISSLLEQKEKILEGDTMEYELSLDDIDVTLPVQKHRDGGIHPVTYTIAEIIKILAPYGFSVYEGPNVEDTWHNFAALNFPDHHPARNMHATFYMKSNPNLLLRTHTSPMQIRIMKENKPPFAFLVPGRTYRSDSDATHTPMFHQIEGVYVSKHVSMGNMKYVLRQLVEQFFGKKNVHVRLRPSFFPFTEPSAELDINLGKKWLEVLGCGMIHPNVLKNVGLDPKKYSGFAFGLGIERFAMLKHNIIDLRNMFEGSSSWLKHYNFGAFDLHRIIRNVKG